jgi:hypothetical protein
MKQSRRESLEETGGSAFAPHTMPSASSGASNRRATRGTRFVPEPRQGGDAPSVHSYTRATSRFDPDQSSLFHWKNRKAASRLRFQKASARRLSYSSPRMARYEIPKQLPELVECGDAFVPSDEATLEEWQRHKNPDNSVDQILKLANKLALPDNIPLLPRLRALAEANVLAFNRKFWRL